MKSIRMKNIQMKSTEMNIIGIKITQMKILNEWTVYELEKVFFKQNETESTPNQIRKKAYWKVTARDQV